VRDRDKVTELKLTLTHFYLFRKKIVVFSRCLHHGYLCQARTSPSLLSHQWLLRCLSHIQDLTTGIRTTTMFSDLVLFGLKVRQPEQRRWGGRRCSSSLICFCSVTIFYFPWISKKKKAINKIDENCRQSLIFKL